MRGLCSSVVPRVAFFFCSHCSGELFRYLRVLTNTCDTRYIHYRCAVTAALPSLVTLDCSPITKDEREQAVALFGPPKVKRTSESQRVKQSRSSDATAVPPPPPQPTTSATGATLGPPPAVRAKSGNKRDSNRSSGDVGNRVMTSSPPSSEGSESDSDDGEYPTHVP